MIVASGGSVTTTFTTNDDTGASADADSTPTGTVYLNGTANGVSVTVTNIATGLYKAAFTMPAGSAGDSVQLVIAATVGGTASKAKVWEAVVTPSVNLASTGLDSVLTAEPASKPIFGTTTIKQAISALLVPITNKKTFSKATGITSYRNNADSGDLWTTTATDNGTTRTVGKAT